PLGILDVEVGHQNSTALACEALGRRPSDPRSRADDQCCAPVESSWNLCIVHGAQDATSDALAGHGAPEVDRTGPRSASADQVRLETLDRVQGSGNALIVCRSVLSHREPGLAHI